MMRFPHRCRKAEQPRSLGLVHQRITLSTGWIPKRKRFSFTNDLLNCATSRIKAATCASGNGRKDDFCPRSVRIGRECRQIRLREVDRPPSWKLISCIRGCPGGADWSLARRTPTGCLGRQAPTLASPITERHISARLMRTERARIRPHDHSSAEKETLNA
jgi:hypothetical protein